MFRDRESELDLATIEMMRQLERQGRLYDETPGERRVGLPEDRNRVAGMLFNPDLDNTEPDHPGPSAEVQKNSASTPPLPCIACTEATNPNNTAALLCGHHYCASCLNTHFAVAMSDESSFPPHCCGFPIVINTARHLLTPDIMKQYSKMKAEFETPNKTYCHVPGCSAFIPPSLIEGETAICPECGLATCASCKGRAHKYDCPRDAGLHQLLVLAQKNGWKRCWFCKRMVERVNGCSYMACRCGAHFCYNCGRPFTLGDCACVMGGPGMSLPIADPPLQYFRPRINPNRNLFGNADAGPRANAGTTTRTRPLAANPRSPPRARARTIPKKPRKRSARGVYHVERTGPRVGTPWRIAPIIESPQETTPEAPSDATRSRRVVPGINLRPRPRPTRR